MTILDDVRADAKRYPDAWYWEPGFWATATYRWGKWARSLPSPWRFLALVPQKLCNQYFHIVYQVDISPHAEIAGGLALIHPRNVLIGGCKIGRNCLIFQEVTLGMNANSHVFPELGDDVDIYAGARVVGEIKLGHKVKVGANCVVNQNVPDGCTVVVAKNRVIPRGLVEAFGPRRSPEAKSAGLSPETAADAPPQAPSESGPPAASALIEASGPAQESRNREESGEQRAMQALEEV